MARWRRVEERRVSSAQERALGHLKDGWVAVSRVRYVSPLTLRALERKGLAEQRAVTNGRTVVQWRATPKGVRVWQRLAGLLPDKPSRWTTHLRPEPLMPIHTPQQRQAVVAKLSPTQQDLLRRLSSEWCPQEDLQARCTTLRVLERRRMIEADQTEWEWGARPPPTTCWRLTSIGSCIAEELPSLE